MDCHVALELLEVVGCDSDDLELAIAHIESCGHCGAVYRDRLQLDREIGRVLRDVAVPLDLKQRIHCALIEVAGERVDQVAGVGESVDIDGVFSARRPLEAPIGAAPVRRRTWLRVAVSLACLIGSVIVWQLWIPSEVRFSLKELQGKTDLKIRFLPEFDRGFSADLPFGWDTSRLLFIDSTAKGYSVSDGHPHVVALYGFDFRVSRPRTLHGVLLVVPKSSVLEPAAASSLGSASITYERREQRRFATAAWTEDDFVYVVFVQGGADHLEEIQEYLRIQPT